MSERCRREVGCGVWQLRVRWHTGLRWNAGDRYKSGGLDREGHPGPGIVDDLRLA